MKRILNKSRSKWEKVLLSLCAFFWAGCDESTSNSATLYGCPSDVCGDPSSSSTETSSSTATNESSSSSSSTFDLCSLEYTEAQLQTALDNGYITDKTTCALGNIIALYGSPAMFDSIAKVNASTTLIYEDGVGCYRCPNDEISSSSASSSSSVATNSSSSEQASSSSSTSVEGCSLEITEASLEAALSEGSIYDKALCSLGEVATDYGVPYSSDASSVNSGPALIYQEGVGCYRCPGDESSSSVAQSSSSVSSSSSSSTPKSSSSRTSYDDCSLEITEAQLASALSEGSISNKTNCVLTEFAPLYGISYPINPNESTSSLIYVEGDGCYRCPDATESSSSETSEEK
jgi:hypothetical protein